MSNRVAGPWVGYEVYSSPAPLLRRVDPETGRTVARVLLGPADTHTSWTVLRPSETTYGYATAGDAQRWADFELGDAGYTLTPGPLDPPPLVERKQRGCLAASLGLIALGLSFIAAAIGVGVWL